MARDATPIKPTQGERIKRIIRDLDISQAKFARIVGIWPAEISRICTGKRGLTENFARRIHDKLPQYSVPWLLGYVDDHEGIDEAEIARRTRFEDKYLCSVYAIVLLYEYFHNDELRKRIDDIAHGRIKANFMGKEATGFQGFTLCMSPLMACIGDDIYKLAEEYAMSDREDEEED